MAHHAASHHAMRTDSGASRSSLDAGRSIRNVVVVMYERGPMPTHTAPLLYCPFPLIISDHVEALEDHTLKWLRRFNLITDATACQHFRTMKIGWLVSHAYPDACVEGLQIVILWTTLFLLLDDYSETAGLSNHPEAMEGVYGRFLDILRGTAVSAEDGGLSHGLKDLRTQMLQRTSQAWMDRFVQCVEQSCKAWVWEATNRKRGIIPDKATYLRMRPFSSGLYAGFELIEMTGRMELPQAVRMHPDIQRLCLTANYVFSWANDLFSLASERRQRDVHNLVLILQHEEQLTLDEAIQHVIAMHDNEMRHLLVIERRLPSFGVDVDRDIQRYVSTIHSMLRSNLEWLQTTGRYRGSNQGLDDVDRDSSLRSE